MMFVISYLVYSVNYHVCLLITTRTDLKIIHIACKYGVI